MAYYKRHIIMPLLTVLLALGASGQVTDAATHDPNLFNHLDLGVNAGTTGIGLNVSTPVTSYARLRVGLDYMPRTHVPLTFNLMAYAGTDDEIDQDTKFEKLSALMHDFTGFDIDKKVNMNAKGTMVDFKMLVDVFPFRNKHFYATAGFYWGSSKVGHIENDIHEAPSLIGVMMYNKMYDYFMNYDYLYEPLYGDIYFDPISGDAVRSKFERYGRVGAHMGEFNGKQPNLERQAYMLEPDEDGMVRADMYVHKFKPYLGAGYTCNIGHSGHWKFSVDAGALFWGKPKILTHERYKYGSDDYGTVLPGQSATDYGDRIDVGADVDNIGGRVGKYVRLARAMHVFPSLSLRLTYTLF